MIYSHNQKRNTSHCSVLREGLRSSGCGRQPPPQNAVGVCAVSGCPDECGESAGGTQRPILEGTKAGGVSQLINDCNQRLMKYQSPIFIDVFLFTFSKG